MLFESFLQKEIAIRKEPGNEDFEALLSRLQELDIVWANGDNLSSRWAYESLDHFMHLQGGRMYHDPLYHVEMKNKPVYRACDIMREKEEKIDFSDLFDL